MRQAIAFTLAAALFSLPLAADQTRITFSDPAGDITADEGDAHPIDIVNVDVSSDGEFVVVAVTLAEAPRPTSLFQALVAGVAFDVDNDRKSGGQGFGGMHGDVPGIDFESEILSSVEDGAVSTSSAASVIGVDVRGNQSNVLSSSDAPSTPAKGKVYTGKIAYLSLGVKSGQSIRVIARELNDRGELHGMFPEASLTLK
ncbi:MAG TPA: hypothetical protein VGQ36_26465 [Thermoanaerobaculia bacterium]|nr:hypothetical protein [Thermoanaerobaculia bacterium]